VGNREGACVGLCLKWVKSRLGNLANLLLVGCLAFDAQCLEGGEATSKRCQLQWTCVAEASQTH